MRIFKIKPNKETKLRAWCEEVNTTRKDEAIESLKEENCNCEIFSIATINNEPYLLTHMDGKNLKRGTDSEINLKHRAIMRECIEAKVGIECLYKIEV